MNHYVKMTGMLLFVLMLCACATSSSPPTAFPSGPSKITWDENRLAQSIDDFYRATTIEDAQKAVDEAIQIAPNAPQSHEIAGYLAYFKGNESESWSHFYKGIASPLNKNPYMYFLAMSKLPWTHTQYQQTLELLTDVLEQHPDENFKRLAASYVANWNLRLNANTEEARSALGKRGLLTKFAVINPFDNEDGKGFTTEYPPERELDYEAEYQGTLFPAKWRVNVPVNHQNHLDFIDLVSPREMTTAYANTYAWLPEEGNYHIRVSTTDPIRMWVNDIQVLSQQVVDNESPDQFVVPVSLRKGWNKILLKSCHEQGPWSLGVALTRINGALIKGLKNSAEKQTVNGGVHPGPGFDFKTELERRFFHVQSPLQKLTYAIELAESMGLTGIAQDFSDIYRAAVPQGIFSLHKSALISWMTGGRGDTIDILDHLIEKNDKAAPRLFLLRSSFFEEQGRNDKARENLLLAIEANPTYRSARLHLADNYRKEGWIEDYLNYGLQNQTMWPDDTRILWGLSNAYLSLGRRPDAERIHKKILQQWKGAQDVLEQLSNDALLKNDYKRAIRFQRNLCGIYPNTPGCYLALGKLYRKAGQPEKAIRAFEKARAIDQRWSEPLVLMGEIAYEAGDTKSAVQYWNQGLEFDPDNHSLADRIEYIQPKESGLLEDYVPNADDIKQILQKRGEVELYPGANVVYLLDHSVEKLKADGSSRKVDTLIRMAINDTGRDQLTSYYFPPGRLKVLEAYAVDPNGSRREASSLRGREVRFRELKAGSTVVLQYRIDSHPYGYLAQYPFRRWFFHGLNVQFEDSKYVLMIPQGVNSSEWGQGDWKRSEEHRNGHTVVSYHATHVPPVIPEPASPPIIDLLDQVIISINAEWDSIAQWDKALLVDVFRTTPFIKDVAHKLTKDARTQKDKLNAITRFVMKEIRYQQDYENTIAGVKPHTASVVLQRGYGDCKDKSVLIMTLAKEVGIRTKFAILRTTGMGNFIKSLPFLQFNHAIVFVPAQPGIEEAFFVDATPDTLDLVNLRPDDQGTWAMTIDPDSNKWEFVEIPYAPAEDHFTIRTTQITPAIGENEGEESESHIQVKLTAQGPTAASIRQVLRNPDNTKVFAAQIISQLFPGATVQNITFEGHEDIVRPLTVSIDVVSNQLVRKQGESLVIDIPQTETLSQLASLENRTTPLQLSYYLSHIENRDEIAIPSGYEVTHVPENVVLDNPFFHFERITQITDQSVVITLRFTEKTTLVGVDQYDEFRALAQEVTDNVKEDLVFGPIDENKSHLSKSKKRTRR